MTPPPAPNPTPDRAPDPTPTPTPAGGRPLLVTGDRIDRAGGHDPLHRITDLAVQITGLSTAVLVFVDGPAGRVLAASGDDRPPRLHALDAWVAGHGRPVLAGDLTALDRTAPEVATALEHAGPATGEPMTGRSDLSGAYLGVPVRDSAGLPIGVLAVSDGQPRVLRDRHLRLVRDLAAITGDQLDLLRRADALEDDHRAGAELAAAIRGGEIVPWYQPMLDLATGRVIGVEALARRRMPSGAVVGPQTFIPLAERTDQIVDLDLAVIRRALTDLAVLQEGYPGLRMSLNLSGRQLDRRDWAEQVLALTRAAGVAPETVELELTETARPADPASGAATMQWVRDQGFEIWFDDFGTGWSALQDLMQLPVDGIKLDRSFADELGSHADDAIIRALIAAARELGLQVTIEGIETAEQAELARALGCDHAQGYLWSPAVPVEDLVAMLASTVDGRLPSSATRD
ncbi:EAL domain-containing protein (putative c-di-GMP-specific phosphodiesterase class I) [Friedmanniella endophytica]|uniref:EAL domain-containing protein (Putative c-di-GMP-specific phosphodiesterase class I) n=1 Tax=Microlunatus kandeliicorticis TaxID=1759536 RepID=A0A7W3P7M2_9ACTN|nr:EAL domain-containing protein [Microlunatus kandeliicorticis]MBA8796092.1 EAL domain-containing protein (putative c-di-GMP-specific phosphodiesterase class I) [Microlunatus kandeliicorticis]